MNLLTSPEYCATVVIQFNHIDFEPHKHCCFMHHVVLKNLNGHIYIKNFHTGNQNIGKTPFVTIVLMEEFIRRL